jgi:hypothetical protein
MERWLFFDMEKIESYVHLVTLLKQKLFSLKEIMNILDDYLEETFAITLNCKVEIFGLAQSRVVVLQNPKDSSQKHQ